MERWERGQMHAGSQRLWGCERWRGRRERGAETRKRRSAAHLTARATPEDNGEEVVRLMLYTSGVGFTVRSEGLHPRGVCCWRLRVLCCPRMIRVCVCV